MKLIIIILLCFASVFPLNSLLRDRIKAVQQAQDKMIVKQESKTASLISTEKKQEEPQLPEYRVYAGNHIAVLEARQQDMQKALDNAIQSLQDTREVLAEVVATLEKQNQISQTQTDKSDRTTIILNIVLGIIGLFAAWKNKHLLLKPKV
jgi:cell division protein FtsB